MNETVCFISLGKSVAFYNPKPKTASFPAKKIIRINTHAMFTLEVGFLEQLRGGK